MQFSINPGLDIGKAKLDYSQHQRTNLTELLPQNQLTKLSELVQTVVNYKQAFFINNQYHQSSYEKLRALPPQESQTLLKQVYEHAAKGIGFWYGREEISNSSDEEIQSFLNWLNSESIIDLIKNISGIDEITCVSAQVTRFLPGDFLTRHQDDVGDEKRRIAYSFGLSPNWHPDWGGLLQFFEKDGTPTEAWSPNFNTMNLFDVKHVHSVTSITPFSPVPRFAISGWFKEV